MRNSFEEYVAKQLTKAKVSFVYEEERIPYVIYSDYIPDYILTTSKGKLYLEAKGYFRPEAKRKMAAIKQQHPELDIRFVFCSKNPLKPTKSCKQNIRWAEKYKYKWCINDIPKDWLL